MTACTFPRLASPIVTSVIQWWRSLGRALKLTGALSIGIICATVAACSVVAEHIQELFADKASASTALYMDSVVQPLVQELALNPALSQEKRAALEQLMAPVSIGKPVIAFRIWVADQIVFSTRGELVGKQFAPTRARIRAYEGNVVASLGLEGDDEEDERELRVPILETYAPVRQIGTNKIIALAETSELAGTLMQEIRAVQYVSYGVLAGGAIALILVLFGLTGGLQKQIGELLQQRVQDKLRHTRVCSANQRVLEINEKNLRRVERELDAGPLQLIAFAQLRLDALREAPDKLNEEVAAISAALHECMKRIRGVSSGLTPSDLQELPLAEVIGTAICLHEARTGTEVSCEFRNLPQEIPYVLKSCVYRIIEQALANVFRHSPYAKVHVCASREQDRLEVELICRLQPTASRLVNPIEDGCETLRHQIEALGGLISARPNSDGQLSIVVGFWLGDRSDQS